MALSLGVKAGDKIKVGEHVVQVKTLTQPNLIVLTVDAGPDIVVSDLSRTEILPKVFVFSGVNQGGSGNRLAFEADKSIRILRIRDGYENKQ